MANGHQRVLRRELKHLHPDELSRPRLPRDIQDQIAVTHPRSGAASEADAVELTERLLLVRRLLQLRRHELPDGGLERDEQSRGDERAARQTGHRDTGGADHRDLAAAGELAEADDRADEGGDGQQLIDLLRQIEQRVPECIHHRVMADPDVTLLADEDEQAAEDEQHDEHQRHRTEHGAQDVTVENVHAGPARR
jgi:hypothetical protein